MGDLVGEGQLEVCNVVFVDFPSLWQIFFLSWSMAIQGVAYYMTCNTR